MYIIQSKSAKMLKNVTYNQEKNQLVKINSKIKKVMDLIDKNVETAIRNLFRYMKKNKVRSRCYFQKDQMEHLEK